MKALLAVCFGLFAALLVWPLLSISNRPLLLAGIPSLIVYLFSVWAAIVLVLVWNAVRSGADDP